MVDRPGGQPATATGARPPRETLAAAMAAAHQAWRQGDAAQAVRLCRAVLAAAPELADALHLLGVIAHANGQLDLGIDLLRRACDQADAPALYHSNLCEMLRQKGGHHDEAAVHGRRAVALDDRLAQGWNNLAIVLQEQGVLEESRTCLERCLALTPGFSEAHSNLGNTLKKLGLLTQARAEYETALRLKPDYPEAHANIAAVLNQLGEAELAMAAARRSMELDPRHTDAYINAAAVETGRDNDAEAIRWLDRLLAFAPDHAPALAARASALRQLGRTEEAVAVARRAAALAPGNADILNALGVALQHDGAVEEAVAVFERAATCGPDNGAALASKAGALVELGRGAEAMALFDQVVARFPRQAAAWLNRADGKTFAAGDPDIEAMRALLGPGGLEAPDERMAIDFALGKALLDARDPAAAFAHLAAGNRRKRAITAHDADATTHWIGRIAESFPPDLIERFKGSGDPSELPVFVVGMPRSGTTLIEQILASHPLITGAGELPHLRNVTRNVRGQDGAPVPFPLYVPALQPEHLGQLGGRYLAKIAPLAGGTARVVDKMPSNFLFAGLIPLMLPRARIIHVMRDPVDTCLSCYTKLFAGEQSFAYDLAELGRFWLDYRRLMAHWRAVLPPGSMLEVEYEAVVDDLEGEARRMLDFLGMGWDPAVLRFHETPRVVRTASRNQVRRPLYRTSVGRWRPYAAHLGPLLDTLGVKAEG